MKKVNHTPVYSLVVLCGLSVGVFVGAHRHDNARLQAQASKTAITTTQGKANSPIADPARSTLSPASPNDRIGSTEDAFTKLAGEDPKNTVAMALKLPSRQRQKALTAVFSIWMTNDAEAAWSWIGTNQNAGERTADLLAGAGAAAAATGLRPQDLLSRTKRLDILNQHFLLERYLIATGSENIPVFAAQITSLNNLVQEQTMETVMKRWSAIDSTAAIQWLNNANFSEATLNRAYAGIAIGLASGDARAAVEWASNLPVERQEEALRNSIKSWIEQRGLGEFVAWFSASDLPNRDTIFARSFWSVIGQDPFTALQLTGTLKSDELATDYRQKAFNYLSVFDRAKAIVWLAVQTSKPDYPQFVSSLVLHDAEYFGVQAFKDLSFARNQKERDDNIRSLLLSFERFGHNVTYEQVQSLGILDDNELKTVRTHLGDASKR